MSQEIKGIKPTILEIAMWLGDMGVDRIVDKNSSQRRGTITKINVINKGKVLEIEYIIRNGIQKTEIHQDCIIGADFHNEGVPHLRLTLANSSKQSSLYKISLFREEAYEHDQKEDIVEITESSAVGRRI